MELDLPSLFGLHVHCAQLYSLAETPQLTPPPAFGFIYEGLLVSQDRRHLSFVTPWSKLSYRVVNQLGGKGFFHHDQCSVSSTVYK
jgi:hypothetical protein